MLIGVMTCALLLAIVANGLMAGVFFGFSVGVMPGLDTTEDKGAADAMRAINTRILNPVFFTAFFGAPLLSLLAAIPAFVAGHPEVGVIAVAAAVVYLAGAFAPTAAVNVPMNQRLAADERAGWAEYSRRWTRWNTIRAVACVAATLLLAVASIAWGAAVNAA